MEAFLDIYIHLTKQSLSLHMECAGTAYRLITVIKFAKKSYLTAMRLANVCPYNLL